MQYAQQDSAVTAQSEHVTGHASNGLERLRAPLSELATRFQLGARLSLRGRHAFTLVHADELRGAIAATLEVAVMGSALVLTLCLQLQEVVASRGGFATSNAALYIFVIACSMSFMLAFYSLVAAAAMLLGLSTYPARYDQ